MMYVVYYCILLEQQEAAAMMSGIRGLLWDSPSGCMMLVAPVESLSLCCFAFMFKIDLAKIRDLQSTCLSACASRKNVGR